MLNLLINPLASVEGSPVYTICLLATNLVVCVLLACISYKTFTTANTKSKRGVCAVTLLFSSLLLIPITALLIKFVMVYLELGFY